MCASMGRFVDLAASIYMYGPELNGSFLREAVLYSWKGISLVRSFRELVVPSTAPAVAMVAARDRSLHLCVYVYICRGVVVRGSFNFI